MFELIRPHLDDGHAVNVLVAGEPRTPTARPCEPDSPVLKLVPLPPTGSPGGDPESGKWNNEVTRWGVMDHNAAVLDGETGVNMTHEKFAETFDAFHCRVGPRQLINFLEGEVQRNVQLNENKK